MPLPMVFATSVPKRKKAAIFQNAAQMTAWIGVSTRVATIVATEFALSCMPFVKSKQSATATMIPTSKI